MRNDPSHPSLPISRQMILPAPYLTSRGACSDCHIPGIAAGDGDIKICPRCYAMLWHRDYGAEQRREKQAVEVRRAEKEAQKQLDREFKAPPEVKG